MTFACQVLSDEAWFHLTCYVKSQNARIWSAENSHAAHETPFTLSRLEFGVQCLAVGLLVPFSSKTLLTRGATLTLSMKSLEILLKRNLPKHGSNKTAQHAIRHGRQCASCPCCSEIELFRNDYGPHARRICHHQNQHIQHHCPHFTHDAAGSVYEHASSCSVMYAACWGTLSELFVTRCIVNTLF
jgi:hypothetical protein